MAAQASTQITQKDESFIFHVCQKNTSSYYK